MSFALRKICSLSLLAVLAIGCSGRPGCRMLGKTSEGPNFWVCDDSVRISRKSGQSEERMGRNNPLWSPESPVKLFGLPGESLSFQVVASADSLELRDIQVSIILHSEDNRESPRIERFVVLDLPMSRRSGGKQKGESLGWSAKATPKDPSRQNLIADPLIPVEHAPTAADYPMTVPPGDHRVIWVDLEIPLGATGNLKGQIQIQGKTPNGDSLNTQIPLELEIGKTPLPYAAIKTMVYFAPKEIVNRIGSDQALKQFQQLMHRHHLTTFSSITSIKDLEAQLPALTGQLFDESHSYTGPGAGKPSDLIVLGSYGGFGDPTPAKVDEISQILSILYSNKIEDSPGNVDIFLYAIDEQCESPRAQAWKLALSQSPDPRTQKLRVGHTCSEDPAKQAVDIAMVSAEAFDATAVNSAKRTGKTLWIYNGWEPKTGSFLTDSTGIGLRANGWLQQSFGIERWFYWESTFWNDDNRGGKGPYDPLAQAETFHNQHGDFANGDGVLVYPGRQVVGRPWMDLHFDGVIASIRLKQWRRGIQDAAYIRLAQEISPAETQAVLRQIVPSISDITADSKKPLWSSDGTDYFRARRQLFEIIRRTPLRNSDN